MSTKPVGRGMVTIKPVASTVGLTVESLDVTAKVVPAGKADPEGASVPVKTRVLPAVADSMVISWKVMWIGVGG